MGFFTQEETVGLFADTGDIPVVFGAQSTAGHFDVDGRGVFDGQDVSIIGTDLVARITTGSITGLKEGLQISVDGQTYVIIKALEEDDRDSGMTAITLKGPIGGS